MNTPTKEQIAFEDAASRGFPEGNRVELQAAMNSSMDTSTPEVAPEATGYALMGFTFADAASEPGESDAAGAISVADGPEVEDIDASVPLSPEAAAFLDSLDPVPAGPEDMKVYDQIAKNYSGSSEGPTES